MAQALKWAAVFRNGAGCDLDRVEADSESGLRDALREKLDPDIGWTIAAGDTIAIVSDDNEEEDEKMTERTIPGHYLDTATGQRYAGGEPVGATNRMTCIVGVEQHPRIQFTIETGEDGPPLIIRLSDGTHIVKVGQYASPGNRYCYQRTEAPAALPADTVIKPWEKHTGLKG